SLLMRVDQFPGGARPGVEAETSDEGSAQRRTGWSSLQLPWRTCPGFPDVSLITYSPFPLTHACAYWLLSFTSSPVLGSWNVCTPRIASLKCSALRASERCRFS